MTDISHLHLEAVGMVTPLGGELRSTGVAVKAGVNCYYESTYIGRFSRRMKLCSIPDEYIAHLIGTLRVKTVSARQSRMVVIAAEALTQVVNNIKGEAIPLFLSVPEITPNSVNVSGSEVIALISQQADVGIDTLNSRVFKSGRAGGFQALDMAFRYLQASGKRQVLVGGVDSYIDPNILGILDEQDRVLTEVSLEGFAPSEGAGMLLLNRDPVPLASTKKLTQIYLPGLSNEEGFRGSDKPNLGNGLSNALKVALTGNSGKVNKIYASFNGESFSNKEYGVAVMRNASSLAQEYSLEHPADCFGDVGAAFMPVLTGLASVNEVGENVVMCCSDNELRGCARLHIS